MKARRALLAVSLAIGLFDWPVLAQSNVYSVNIVGYVNRGFSAGFNLFGNPLDAPDNFLTHLIPRAPEGTSVGLWDSSSSSFSPMSTFSGGGWSQDLFLPPGQGVGLMTPTAFTNTFVGSVLGLDGLPIILDVPLQPPPPFSGPDGIYLLSSKCPLQMAPPYNYPAFEFIVGRGPVEGEQFMRSDPETQTFRTTTFSSGAWDNGQPELFLADAAFFNLGPGDERLEPSIVPEPAAVALLLLSGAALLLRRRIA